MNAQTLLEILLQAANAGVDLSSLQVVYPCDALRDGWCSEVCAEDVEINDDQISV